MCVWRCNGSRLWLECCSRKASVVQTLDERGGGGTQKRWTLSLDDDGSLCVLPSRIPFVYFFFLSIFSQSSSPSCRQSVEMLATTPINIEQKASNKIERTHPSIAPCHSIHWRFRPKSNGGELLRRTRPSRQFRIRPLTVFVCFDCCFRIQYFADGIAQKERKKIKIPWKWCIISKCLARKRDDVMCELHNNQSRKQQQPQFLPPFFLLVSIYALLVFSILVTSTMTSVKLWARPKKRVDLTLGKRTSFISFLFPKEKGSKYGTPSNQKSEEITDRWNKKKKNRRNEDVDEFSSCISSGIIFT